MLDPTLTMTLTDWSQFDPDEPLPIELVEDQPQSEQPDQSHKADAA